MRNRTSDEELKTICGIGKGNVWKNEKHYPGEWFVALAKILS